MPCFAPQGSDARRCSGPPHLLGFRRARPVWGRFVPPHRRSQPATLKRAPARAPFSRPRPMRRIYLILVSLNSTCFLATGSYFFIESFSVIVREFFLVT